MKTAEQLKADFEKDFLALVEKHGAELELVVGYNSDYEADGKLMVSFKSKYDDEGELISDFCDFELNKGIIKEQ